MGLIWGMSMTRAALIEYLCSQQHAARLLALSASGREVEGQPFGLLRAADKQAERAGMATVLEELADLGLLHEKTPAT